MSFTTEDINDLAHLARLHIAPHEVPDYVANLSRILGMVERVNSVATEGVPPLWHPSDMSLRLRTDSVEETGDIEAMRDMAPVTERGLYLVPQVIKE